MRSWLGAGALLVSIGCGSGGTDQPDAGAGPFDAPAETRVPSWPPGSAAAMSAQSVYVADVVWPPAVDDVGIVGYRVRRGGELLGNTLGTSFEVIGLHLGSSYDVEVEASDAAGNWSPVGLRTEFVMYPPPPPAPPLDPRRAVPFAKATEFLYTGWNATQLGVAPGAIDPVRAAVLRGRVITRDGAALPGVSIRIHGHPEFGTTWSRADGELDLAVNGGGPLRVDYARAGYLPAERVIDAAPQDHAWLPEVALVPLDPAPTRIELGAEAQVARGSEVADEDGARRATLVFPPGTTATMTLSDGTIAPLPALTVRATEYTVGAHGAAAMPGELEPATAYTYAVELSADEALAADATRVDFTQPVAFYLENFLGFPDGAAVPAGFYDRALGAWVTSDRGRIVRVVAVSTGGVAVLDIDGDGAADDATVLGVSDAERVRIGAIYSAGQSLWRLPIRHFAPWGPAVPYRDPAGATAPEVPAPVVGSSAGRRCAVTIPLTGPIVPPLVRRIDVRIQVAGELITRSFPPSANLTERFVWDGLDAYGRAIHGELPIKIEVGWGYTPVYYPAPAELERSVDGAGGDGGITFVGPRGDWLVLWRTYQRTIENPMEPGW